MSPWALMWTIAFAEFAVVKLLSLAPVRRPSAYPWRLAAYLGLWPGMNALTFLDRNIVPASPPRAEWCAALAKTILGAAMTAWCIGRLAKLHPNAAGWIGMAGLVLLLHFGLFHLLSCAWRRAGVVAPPLMQSPPAAVTVVEFWSSRWNVAFAETARRLVFRPLARRHGPVFAGITVFALSGLIHESVISLPAGAGWGGPTLYFLIQAAGIGVQRHRVLRRSLFTSTWRDRIWTIVVTAAPAPLLFHPPFVEGVILPFLQHLDTWVR